MLRRANGVAGAVLHPKNFGTREHLGRVTIDKSSYHQLSHFEIGGDNPGKHLILPRIVFPSAMQHSNELRVALKRGFCHIVPTHGNEREGRINNSFEHACDLLIETIVSQMARR
jgi:hypothetical protein